jgi:hypothetical protein
MKLKKIKAYQCIDTEDALITIIPSGFNGQFLMTYEDPYNEIDIHRVSPNTCDEINAAIKKLEDNAKK